MANNRKVAKGVSSGRPRSYSELYRNSRESVANSNPSAAAQAVSAPVFSGKGDNIDWRGEYGHVLADLRRLGIITAILVAAMTVASFFL